MKKVAIIVGHPMKESFCSDLALAYKRGGEAMGAEVKLFQLGEISFDPVLHNGYAKRQDWEPGLKEAAETLLWADHWLFVTPLWWGSMSALLKGFIDRVFLPGIMFRFKDGAPLPEQFMKGKSARVIVTTDSPNWYYRFIIGNPIEKLFKRAILGFCGVHPVTVSFFNEVRKAGNEKKKIWTQQVENWGGKECN